MISEDWLGEKGVGKSSLQAINNAGLTALAFADFISPSAILLVGMDLAGGGDGRVRYAESTGRSHIEINASTFHQIPGNYNKTVPTPFFSDWHETSQATATFSQRRSILNLNDRGAYLDGANLIHPRDFEEVKKRIEASDIDYFEKPYRRFIGSKFEQETFFVEDPNGNVLEIKTMSNPEALFEKAP